MKSVERLSAITFLLAAMLATTACSTTSGHAEQTIQMGPDAEVSFDGLHKVENAQADLAWARPDIDLSKYTKIMPVRAGFEYTPSTNLGRTAIERNRGGPYFIDDSTREKFEALAQEIFQEEIQKAEGWEFVTEPGPDVLILFGGLLDISSNVPPDDYLGRTEIYLTTVGEATLVLELRDSETNTILARSVDRRAAERMGGQMMRSNTVTNSAEVRRLFRFWGQRLVASLNEFAAARNAP
jgi:hypothetical protein